MIKPLPRKLPVLTSEYSAISEGTGNKKDQNLAEERKEGKYKGVINTGKALYYNNPPDPQKQQQKTKQNEKTPLKQT